MDTIQCAIVLAKLERFDWERQRRIEIGRRYTELVNRHPAGARTLSVREGRDNVYAQYTVLVEERQEVQKRLKDQGIPTAVHYPIPLHRQPAYSGHRAHDGCPVSVRLAERVLSLPMHADLEARVQEEIVECLRQSVAESESQPLERVDMA